MRGIEAVLSPSARSSRVPGHVDNQQLQERLPGLSSSMGGIREISPDSDSVLPTPSQRLTSRDERIPPIQSTQVDQINPLPLRYIHTHRPYTCSGSEVTSMSRYQTMIFLEVRADSPSPSAPEEGHGIRGGNVRRQQKSKVGRGLKDHG